MERRENIGEDPEIEFTTELERRLIGRECIGVHEALAAVEDLSEQANECREQAIFEYSAEEDTATRKAKFLEAGQREILAGELVRCAMPRDDELEDMFRFAESEES